MTTSRNEGARSAGSAQRRMGAWRLGMLLGLTVPAVVIAGERPRAAVRLWSGAAPGALGTSEHDVPTLTPTWPRAEEATGAAMVVMPGGAYGILAEHEGSAVARWLADNGVAAFVLRYRLGTHGYRHPIPLLDASRAVRLIRARAGEWGLDPARVGVMGFSAGGHLASMLLTRHEPGDPRSEDPVERTSSRPDLGVLAYPVISMVDAPHAASRANLAGGGATEGLLLELSSDRQVGASTPPCFAWHCQDDDVVPVEHALRFAASLRAAGVPCELHVYERGGHGIGVGTGHPWKDACLDWLRLRRFVR